MVNSLSLVPWPAPGVELQAIDDEMLALVNGALTRLTGMTAIAVRAADGFRSIGGVARALDVSSDDIASAFARLAGEGLVQIHEPGSHVRYRRPDHIGVCGDGDGLALVDLGNGRLHELSESGAQIWLELMDTGTLEETVAELVGAYPDAAGLADEASSFVDGLVAAGLLERLPPED